MFSLSHPLKLSFNLNLRSPDRKFFSRIPRTRESEGSNEWMKTAESRTLSQEEHFIWRNLPWGDEIITVKGVKNWFNKQTFGADLER